MQMISVIKTLSTLNRHRGVTSRVIATSLLLLLVVASNSAFYAKQQKPTSAPLDLNTLHAEILKYKTWTLVNSQPVKMDSVVAALCADLRSRPQSPHQDKYISVYVNDLGQEAMIKAKNPKFPVGTTIIKEKLAEKQSQTPEFFTIMLKREAGYDPDAGDWQYLIMGATKAKLEKPADLERCQSCHSAWAMKSDFISRAYLSPQQRLKLK